MLRLGLLLGALLLVSPASAHSKRSNEGYSSKVRLCLSQRPQPSTAPTPRAALCRLTWA
jgi:hypothetical protein